MERVKIRENGGRAAVHEDKLDYIFVSRSSKKKKKKKGWKINANSIWGGKSRRLGGGGRDD